MGGLSQPDFLRKERKTVLFTVLTPRPLPRQGAENKDSLSATTGSTEEALVVTHSELSLKLSEGLEGNAHDDYQ